MESQVGQETTQTSTPMPPSGNLAVQQPVKLGKFRASKMVVKESWGVLKQDKELVWFPVLSSLVSLLAFGLLVGLYLAISSGLPAWQQDAAGEPVLDAMGYVFLFVYYLVMFFIANFFTSGLYIIAYARFQGQDLSFSEGLSGARKNVGKIFVWSLISATVGVVLQIIADRLKLAGKIVVWLLGAAWSIMTYFSLPSLVIGQKSVKESFKESAAVIRKTWGETIIVNFGVGLVFFLLYMLAFLATAVVIIVSGSWFVTFAMLVLLVLFIVVTSVVSATLSAIFKLALYEYAVTGRVPQGFTPELVSGAIKAKK